MMGDVARAVWAFVAMVTILLAACSPGGAHVPIGPPSGPVTVVIDHRFTPDERGSIVTGAERWSEAVGPENLSFRYLVSTHDVALRYPPFSGEIRIARVLRDSSDNDCPELTDVACAWHGVITVIADNLSNPLSHCQDWERVISHEIGHTFGLDHPEFDKMADTIMRENCGIQPPAPRPIDVIRYCSKNWCRAGTIQTAAEGVR